MVIINKSLVLNKVISMIKKRVIKVKNNIQGNYLDYQELF